jgi:lysophospholipase L1-like esterase
MDAITQLLGAAQPVTWLFCGDSITHGSFHTFGWRDYTQLFAERVRVELGRGADLVVNTAISGDTTRDLLAGFAPRISRLRPDVVFLMIGMNDCAADSGVDLPAFTAGLARLAAATGEIGAQPVLQTTCPVVPAAAPDREGNFGAYMNAIRTLASQRGLPLIDHERFWSDHPDRHPLWMSDAFHPNHYGHRVFAALIFRELGIHDPQSPTCRMFLP